MHIWFSVSILGLVTVLPLYFLSVEHLKLQERYGKERGTKIGEICGLISGWGFFLFWAGVWVSPQPRFTIPILEDPEIALLGFSVPLTNLMISAPLVTVGGWLGIAGTREVTLKVSETHRTERIVTTGVYSVVRHPQYLGGLLAHVGISLLLSGFYSLISTPLIVLIVCLISRKEEKELIREFGEEYEDYRRRVPMLIPGL